MLFWLSRAQQNFKCGITAAYGHDKYVVIEINRENVQML